MIPLMRLVGVIALAGSLASCDVQPPVSANSARQSQSEVFALQARGRMAEDQLKIGIARDTLRETTAFTVMTQRPIRTASTTRVVDVADGDHSTLFAVDRTRGRVLKFERGRGDDERADFVGDPLEYPFRARRLANQLFVSDNRGISIIDAANGGLIRYTRSFYAVHDLAPISTDAIAINPVIRGDGGPIIVIVDGHGKTVRTWGQRQAGPQGVLRNNAHVVSCGDVLAVALIHEPTLFLLSATLERAIKVAIPFPRAEELIELGQRTDLTNPTSGFVWLPTFLGGLACSRQSLFVLLDLPAPRVHQIDTKGNIVATFTGAEFESGRHFSRLAVIERERGPAFYALSREEGAAPTIVELAPLGHQ